MADDRIIVPKTLRYAVLNALNLDTPELTRCAVMQPYSGSRTWGPTSKRRQKPAQLAFTPVRI